MKETEGYTSEIRRDERWGMGGVKERKVTMADAAWRTKRLRSEKNSIDFSDQVKRMEFVERLRPKFINMWERVGKDKIYQKKKKKNRKHNISEEENKVRWRAPMERSASARKREETRERRADEGVGLRKATPRHEGAGFLVT